MSSHAGISLQAIPIIIYVKQEWKTIPSIYNRADTSRRFAVEIAETSDQMMF
jgi:hypothetical protein